jgi:peroxiredoxin
MATESQAPETPRKKPGVASVLVPVAIILAVTLFALGYLRDRDRASHTGEAPGAGKTISTQVGSVIPDIELPSLDGKTTKLSELHSKVTLINFWATWCPPCVKELPSLQRLSDKYAAKGLKVVGISLDEDPETVLEKFLAKNSIKFNSYIDKKGVLADQFDVSGLPLTIVIDANRKILLQQKGDEEWDSEPFLKQFDLWLSEGNHG